MNANKIIETLEEARKASIGERVEMEIINPSAEVLTVIEENGGRVEYRNYEVWCHTDTCAHNSHDPGQERVGVLVFPNWQPKGTYPSPSKLFKGIDDETLLLVIPTKEKPVGIFKRSHGRHFAPSTISADPKPLT